MRFVAGRGAAAELLQAGNRRHRGLPAGALQRRAIGKMLLVGAPWQSYWPEVPWRRGWRHCGRELSGRCCWPELHGRAAGRSTVGELLAGAPWQSCWPAAAGRHYDTKKRVTPKPSWTCGSPSCLLTNCYGCLRFAII